MESGSPNRHPVTDQGADLARPTDQEHPLTTSEDRRHSRSRHRRVVLSATVPVLLATSLAGSALAQTPKGPLPQTVVPVDRPAGTGPADPGHSSLLEAAALSDANPDVYSGAWREPDGRVVLGVTARGAIGRSIEVARLGRLPVPVRVTPAGRSQTELKGVLLDVHRAVPPSQGRLSYADVNWRDNRVDAYSTSPTPALRAALERRFGTAVALTSGQAVGTLGRRNDNSPFFGGAEYGIKRSAAGAVIARCSTGFGFRSATGAPQMLTAGHCFPTNRTETIAATAFTSGYGYLMGVAGASSYRNGDGSVAVNGRQVGDMAVINIEAGKSAAPAIFVGNVNPGTAMTVGGVNNTTSINGGAFNASGRTTGETTGWQVRTANSSYTDSTTGDVVGPVVRAEKQGACIQPGDSGGPTYTVTNGKAFAVGIISGGGGGGSDYFGGALDGCILFYSQVQNSGAFGGGLIASP